MTIRFIINYIFFWLVWNWKITLMLWWFDLYLRESTVHSSLFEYLNDALPQASFFKPGITAIIVMIVVPIINKYIRKVNKWIDELIKKKKWMK